MDLSTPKLNIYLDRHADTAKIQVTCTLYYTTGEVAAMKSGSTFAVTCALFGKDMFINDPISHIDATIIGGSEAAPRISAIFEKTLGQSKLNEDWGRDEIIALVTNYDRQNKSGRSKESNVVTGYF